MRKLGTVVGWFDTFKQDFKIVYLNRIFRNSVEAANLIRDLAEDRKSIENKQGLSDTQWMSILLEFTYFYLHLTDRFAFGHLNERRRGQLMTELEEISITAAVDSLCQGWPEDMKGKIKEECTRNFYIAMEEYSKYQKWAPRKDEGAKDTLLWEFGKEIAELAGRERNAVYILTALAAVTDSLKDLDIRSFIDKAK